MIEFRRNDFGKYESYIRDAERSFNLPVNLLAVVLYQASKYETDHITGKGRNSTGPNAALGIANLTRADCDTLWGGIDKRLDAHASITGAARLLQLHYRRFGNWHDAIIAYHTSADIVRNVRLFGRETPIDAARYVGEARACCRF